MEILSNLATVIVGIPIGLIAFGIVIYAVFIMLMYIFGGIDK